VDEGAGKNTGCLGMMMVPWSVEGEVSIGDEIEVLETGTHSFVRSA